MNRSKFLIVVVVALAVAGVLVTPALAQRMGHGSGGHGACRGFGPIFTAEQQEQIDQIREKYDEQRVELTNRLKVLGLEMGELLESEEPDFKAIEDKMEEASGVRLELAKLRLRIHEEIRPLLTEDQRVLFDRGLARALGRAGAGHGCGRGMMGPGGPGVMMRGPGGRGVAPLGGPMMRQSALDESVPDALWPWYELELKG